MLRQQMYKRECIRSIVLKAGISIEAEPELYNAMQRVELCRMLALVP